MKAICKSFGIYVCLVLGIWSLVIIAQAVAAPTISVLADGTTLQSGSYIRRLPIVSAVITDPNGVNPSTIKITIDGMITSPSITSLTATTEYSASYEASYKVNTALDKGSHIIYVEAANQYGEWATYTLAPVKVLGTVSVSDTPKNYPNPFKAKQGEKTKITYTLSEDGDITILIYDISGNMVKRLSASAGVETSPGLGLGGRQGYNEVEWNGISEFGSAVGNGVYPYLIISQGKVISSGQVAVYD